MLGAESASLEPASYGTIAAHGKRISNVTAFCAAEIIASRRRASFSTPIDVTAMAAGRGDHHCEKERLR
jgi:hypothetical protein